MLFMNLNISLVLFKKTQDKNLQPRLATKYSNYFRNTKILFALTRLALTLGSDFIV